MLKKTRSNRSIKHEIEMEIRLTAGHLSFKRPVATELKEMRSNQKHQLSQK